MNWLIQELDKSFIIIKMQTFNVRKTIRDGKFKILNCSNYFIFEILKK